MIIINRYTCPISDKVSIQAHKLDKDLNITESYPKMITDDISLFKSLDKHIIVCDVVRSAMLDKVNIIK